MDLKVIRPNGDNKGRMQATYAIDRQRIADLLTSALEGGSNYWYMIQNKIEPTSWEFEDEFKRGNGLHWTHDYPLNPGGALLISEQDFGDRGSWRRLDLDTIQSGLQTMAVKYPNHFADFLQENDDADTGDVFLQCCLFGEIIYG